MRIHVVGIIGAALALTATALAAPTSHAATARAGSGPWHLIDGTGHARAGAPVIWENSSHVATVLWYREDGSNKFTYQTITMSAKGKPAATSTDVFSGQHWGSLSAQPTLLSSGNSPLVVFDGLQGSGQYNLGCIYGAKGGTSPWTLQTWSLSNDCVNPTGGAAEGKNGVIAAAWGLAGWNGGHGVEYRVGISSTIPATGADNQIPVDSNGADAAAASVAADTGGSGDFDVAWTRVFTNNNTDGFYVEDVTTHSAAKKAPGSGTNSTSRLHGDMAISGRGGHPGIYLAYCSNASTCKVELWRVGATGAMTVPRSADAYSEMVSAGPSGRMWVAWFNGLTNKVSIVRTNKKVTRFGPVQTFPTACVANGQLGLSGGSSGRVDVALDCGVNKPGVPPYVYAMQVLVPLSVSLSPQTVVNTAAHTVTVTVRDAGDPVANATVRYGTQKVSTNSSGRATIHVAKGTSAGAKHISVSATDYRSGGATLHVTH